MAADNQDEPKTAAIGVRVRPALKKVLEGLAKADRRNLSNYVEVVLENHVAEVTKKEGKARK